MICGYKTEFLVFRKDILKYLGVNSHHAYNLLFQLKERDKDKANVVKCKKKKLGGARWRVTENYLYYSFNFSVKPVIMKERRKKKERQSSFLRRTQSPGMSLW